MPDKAVERKVYFYRINAGIEADGSPVAVDLTPTLSHIGNLAFSKDGRYLDEDEVTLCCWVDRVHANQCFRFAQIRRAGLPMLEQGGRLSDLHIPIDSGLAETIHVVAFPKNIIGADFNFFGPRVTRLSSYFLEKAKPYFPEVSFQPLLRLDVTEALEHLMDIRMFNLRIRASYASVIAQADADLGAAFGAAQRAGEADEMELVLRPKRYSRDSLSSRLLNVTRVLAGQVGLRTEATMFVVKGKSSSSHHVEQVDLLSDHLVSKVQIMRQNNRGRALDRDSAYSEIQKAYESLKGELLIAAAAQVQ